MFRTLVQHATPQLIGKILFVAWVAVIVYFLVFAGGSSSCHAGAEGRDCPSADELR